MKNTQDLIRAFKMALRHHRTSLEWSETPVGKKDKANVSLGDLAEIELGDKVRDIVTGFEGIADCRLEWLNGCVRWQVQPQGLHEGKVKDAHVFDQQQLELVKPSVVVPPVAPAASTGGSRPTPKRSADPR